MVHISLEKENVPGLQLLSPPASLLVQNFDSECPLSPAKKILNKAVPLCWRTHLPGYIKD